MDNAKIGLYPKPESSGESPDMLKEKDFPGVKLKSVKSPIRRKAPGAPRHSGEPEGGDRAGVIYLEGEFGKNYTVIIKPSRAC
jgi:hypothetical protein